MTWSASELLAHLRELDETPRIEAKRGLGKSARDTISAFSNEPDLGGGWLVFGVVRSDAGTYEVVGVDEPDKLQADLVSWCSSDFNRVLRPDIQVETIEGAVVVVAYLPEAQPADKPVYRSATGLPRGAWRRLGSTDQRCTDADLALFASLAQHTPYDGRLLPGAERDDLDPSAILAYRDQLRSARPS